MRLFRGPDYSMDLTAGTEQGKNKGGKHEKKSNLCTHTWGYCKDRSEKTTPEPGDPKRLPHLCGEGEKGHTQPHACTICSQAQS